MDANEPNDSTGAAYGYLASGQSIVGRICSASDTDYFKVRINASGEVRVNATAVDTPLTVAIQTAVGDRASSTIAAGTTGTVTAAFVTNFGTDIFIRVQRSGTLGTDPSYSLTVTYPFTTTARRRGAR